nr:ribonuclease H-like domain-containing protein [Tanacetum cinerariifolium]
MYRASNLKSIKTLDKELETLKEENDVVDGKLARLLKSSKDLESLIESQRPEKIKDGLGYNVVPHPDVDLYLSPKKDLSWTGLPEFADNTVTDYSRPAPTVESTSEEGKNKNSSTSEGVASPITPKSFVKFVKPKDCQSESKPNKKETPKKPPVKYAEMYRRPSKKPTVRGNQRNWNNLKTQQLGPDFAMKKKACYNCGDFSHLANDCRKRVQRETTRSQNHAYVRPSHRPAGHRPHSPPIRPMRSNMNGARSKRTSAVRPQYRAPWVPTVNRNFPPVNRKLPTGIKQSPLEKVHLKLAEKYIRFSLKDCTWLKFKFERDNTPIVIQPPCYSASKDFQDSPDNEEDTRNSYEYLNDLEEEYQARALLAKSKRFFKKGTQRFSSAKATNQTECYKCGKKCHFARDCWSKTLVPSYQSPFKPKPLSSSQHIPKLRSTKDIEAKYNKAKDKMALLSSSASASKAVTIKNKGLIAEAYEIDEEKVPSDDNDMVEVKVLIDLAIEKDTISKEGARNSEWVKISMRKRILRVDQLTKDPSSSRQKDLVFVKSLADDTKASIPGVERPWLSKAEAPDYDSADESSVCSNPLPPLKKLDGAKPICGLMTIKLILRSKFTFKAKTLKGIIINEPSSAPAKGNKSSSASKVNSAPAGRDSSRVVLAFTSFFFVCISSVVIVTALPDFASAPLVVQSESKTNKQETPKKPQVKYAEQYRHSNKKPNVKGNQRNWNNLKSYQLGPEFVLKKKACFSCGDFSHLANDCRKRVQRETTRSQNHVYLSPTHRSIGHRPHGALMRPPHRSTGHRPHEAPMRPPYRSAGHKPHGPLMNPMRPNMNVKTQYRAPWVPTVNRNNPPVNRKFSTGRRNFPTANRKFSTASRKFPTGSTKIHTAAMGRKGKAGSSQNNINDKGYWDSDCSRHMTGNISYLSDFQPFDGGYVSFGQGGCKITGKGTIKTGKLEFENVYFVKDLKYNLFSVSQICYNKNSVLFTDSECIVLGRYFKLLDDANILLRTPRQHNMYSIDLNNIVPHKDLTCLVAKASVDECLAYEA